MTTIVIYTPYPITLSFLLISRINSSVSPIPRVSSSSFSINGIDNVAHSLQIPQRNTSVNSVVIS